MIYLYDDAIVDDLRKSFQVPDGSSEPVVKVVDPEGIPSLAAQVQEDKIQFPIIALKRRPGVTIDTDRTNFTRIKKGVQSVVDPATNQLYYEKAVPIVLEYEMSVLATRTADQDELVRELLFKYTSMYFLTITLPYECSRKVRFGVIINPTEQIENKSATFEYISEGRLYETVIPLKCEGCVLVSYTPASLTRVITEVQPTLK